MPGVDMGWLESKLSGWILKDSSSSDEARGLVQQEGALRAVAGAFGTL